MWKWPRMKFCYSDVYHKYMKLRPNYMLHKGFVSITTEVIVWKNLIKSLTKYLHLGNLELYREQCLRKFLNSSYNQKEMIIFLNMFFVESKLTLILFWMFLKNLSVNNNFKRKQKTSLGKWRFPLWTAAFVEKTDFKASRILMALYE